MNVEGVVLFRDPKLEGIRVPKTGYIGLLYGTYPRTRNLIFIPKLLNEKSPVYKSEEIFIN